MFTNGTVFDPPCPSSFTRDNRLVGNLAIDADPMFGGGHLSTAGLGVNGEAFELILNEELNFSPRFANVSCCHTPCLAALFDDAEARKRRPRC